MTNNDQGGFSCAVKTRILALSGLKVPSWLALVLISSLGLLLSGCFTARHSYGLDQSAQPSKQVVSTKSDPTITGALPAQQSTGWTPHFYPGTGVKPGQSEPQSAPLTPKGIGSAAGLPPKPAVSPVDLPAPPLPLPESTAAPSTTLFGRHPIGRQAGISSRGANFNGTALGWQPKFHQSGQNNTLKIFPSPTPAPPKGFRIANNQAANNQQPLFGNLAPRPLPYPNIGQANVAPPSVANVQRQQVAPAPVQQPRAPQAVIHAAPSARSKVQVFNRPTIQQGPPVATGPTFHMNQNMTAYPKPPVPKGANLVVTGNGYLVDTGDELNIRVLGQTDLTGVYKVDSTGSITMPMISTVFVRGKTVSQISSLIQSRLRQGFLRTPSVAVEVNSARPFYILGQVKNPGKYKFVNGLTVSQAVAIAGGYQPRARKGMVKVTRQTRQGPVSAMVPNEEILMPGDTIYVKQRWF